MNFNMNRKQVADDKKEHQYQPLPDGNYEVFIKSAQQQTTKNGATEFRLELVVRNDLDAVPELAETNAKYHNRHVFMDNWQSKTTGDYSERSMMAIGYAANIPDGTQINGVDHLAQLITGKPIRAYIKQEDNTYNGKTTTVNRVSPFGLDVTSFPNLNHLDNKPNQNNNNNGGFTAGNPFNTPTDADAPTVNDDDLPF